MSEKTKIGKGQGGITETGWDKEPLCDLGELIVLEPLRNLRVQHDGKHG